MATDKTTSASPEPNAGHAQASGAAGGGAASGGAALNADEALVAPLIAAAQTAIAGMYSGFAATLQPLLTAQVPPSIAPIEGFTKAMETMLQQRLEAVLGPAFKAPPAPNAPAPNAPTPAASAKATDKSSTAKDPSKAGDGQ